MLSGTDGNVWYGTSAEGIGRITTSGSQLSPIYTNASVGKMVVDPTSGDVWFLDGNADGYAYRMTAGNIVHTIDFGATGATDISVSPDDSAWIAVNNGGEVVRIDSAGTYAGYYLPGPGAGTYGIAAPLADGIWVTTTTGQVFSMNPQVYQEDGLPFEPLPGS